MNLLKSEKLNLRKKHAELIIRSVDDFFQTNCRLNTRKREVVFPRQVAMHLINKYTNLSQEENGKLFNRHHACVNHANNTVFNILSYNNEFKVQLYVLEKTIVKKTEESSIELEKSSLIIDINNLIKSYSKNQLSSLKKQLS